MAPACRDGGQDSDGLLLLQAPMKSHPPDRWAPARAPSPADRSPERHEVSQKPSQTGPGTLHPHNHCQNPNAPVGGRIWSRSVGFDAWRAPDDGQPDSTPRGCVSYVAQAVG